MVQQAQTETLQIQLEAKRLPFSPSLFSVFSKSTLLQLIHRMDKGEMSCHASLISSNDLHEKPCSVNGRCPVALGCWGFECMSRLWKQSLTSHQARCLWLPFNLPQTCRDTCLFLSAQTVCEYVFLLFQITVTCQDTVTAAMYQNVHHTKSAKTNININ